ncbi:MAG TPA: hypothetical protein VF796_29895 [Humisphaera sp.]
MSGDDQGGGAGDGHDEEQAGDGEPQRRQGPGCAWTSFALGAVLVVGSVGLMNRWESLPGYGRVLAIVAAVFGTLLVTPMLALLALKLVLRLLFRKIARDIGTAAKGMVDLGKVMFAPRHEYRPATPDDIPAAARDRYDAATAELLGLDFRHLGDVVNVTIAGTGMSSPAIRVFTSPDGSTSAGIYHLPKDPADPTAEPVTLDLETELTDGTYVVTNNTGGRNLMTPSPAEHRVQRPPATPVPELAALHAAELQKVLAAKPGTAAVPLGTLDEVMSMQHRLQRAKSGYRESIGYVDPDEVGRIADATNDEAIDVVRPQLVDAVDAARRREQGGRPH